MVQFRVSQLRHIVLLNKENLLWDVELSLNYRLLLWEVGKSSKRVGSLRFWLRISLLLLRCLLRERRSLLDCLRFHTPINQLLRESSCFRLSVNIQSAEGK